MSETGQKAGTAMESESESELGLRSKTQLRFVCQLGLCAFHCGVLSAVCVCECVCLWCECYGNLLSSAYTKLETRKALGNLHESCPQTALQAVRGSGRGSTPQRQRKKKRERQSAGCWLREKSVG